MTTKEWVRELRLSGNTINQIIDSTGLAKSTVSYHLKTLNLGGVIDKSLDYNLKSEEEKVIGLRKSGKTYEEIFILTPLTKDSVRGLLRREGLNRPAIRYKELDSEEVTKYYLKVGSLRKTSEKFNVSRGTLRKVIKNEDVITKRPKKVSKSQAVIDWRRRQKRKLVEYKGGKCEVCGYDRCDKALEFHHIDPNMKDFNISGRSYSFDRMKNEVDKCILICSNCHKEVHDDLVSY